MGATSDRSSRGLVSGLLLARFPTGPGRRQERKRCQVMPDREGSARNGTSGSEHRQGDIGEKHPEASGSGRIS